LRQVPIRPADTFRLGPGQRRGEPRDARGR
jgi:hypothetical protein